MNEYDMRKLIAIVLILIYLLAECMIAHADTNPFHGTPKNAVLQVSNLDNSGGLIYVGVDFAVFEDGDKDGVFQAKENKVKRIITNHTTVTVGLGAASDYKKGVVHKLAMRTLYVPIGPKDQHSEIVIDSGFRIHPFIFS